MFASVCIRVYVHTLYIFSEPLEEEHLPTPVTRTSLPKRREVAAKALKITNNTGSAEKDQRNMVNSFPPEGYYGYTP